MVTPIVGPEFVAIHLTAGILVAEEPLKILTVKPEDVTEPVRMAAEIIPRSLDVELLSKQQTTFGVLVKALAN